MIMPKIIKYEPGYHFPGTRLTYVGEASPHITSGGNKKRQILCECSCDGNTKSYLISSLRTGNTRSCGCFKRESLAKEVIVHGYSTVNHPLHHRWAGMKYRCTNPNDERYHRYGGRGITFCPEWSSFKNYAEWIVENIGWPPNDAKSQLDRIDNNGNYEPGNMRWVTNRFNVNNRECSTDHPNVKVMRESNRKAYSVNVHMSGCYRDTKAEVQKLVEKFHAEFGDDLARMANWLDEAA